MAYEYTVYFRKEKKTDSVTNQPGNNQNATPTSQAPKVGGEDESSTASLAKAMIVSEGKRYAKYAVSNVGKYTGDSALQADINVGIEAGGMLVLAVSNPYVAVATAAFNGTKTLVDRFFETAQENGRVEMARARNGYSDLESIMTSRRH